MEDSLQNCIDNIWVNDDAEILSKLDKYRIKASNKYSEKDYLLERDGVGFSPRGNVMALTAEKKAGKSWFAMSLCAALLAGQFLGIQSRNVNAKVLFFDTEQDESDGQRIQRRVHGVCGWNYEEDHDNFHIYHLRELTCEDRKKFVVRAIDHLRPDFVILDGVRDLLKDFNDIEQSVSLVGDLLRLSSEHNCAIWAVLHVNPNSDKMRGHLGTELGNKVADILYMNKHKNTDDTVFYSMEEVAARSHKDIKTIKFKIDDNVPYGLPVLINESEVHAIGDSERRAINVIMQRYVPTPGSISLTSLVNEIKAGEKIGSNKAYNLARNAINEGIIQRASNGKMIYLGLKKQNSGGACTCEEEKVPF